MVAQAKIETTEVVMFRKYVIVTLAMALCLGTVSCTSKGKDDKESEIDASADGEAIEAADAKQDNSDLETTSTKGASDAVVDLGNDDLSTEDKMADDKGPPVSDGGSTAGGDVTANELADAPPPTTTPDVAGNDAPPAGGDVAPPPEMAPAPPESRQTTPDPGERSAPSSGGSLQKIKAQPEKIGKTLVNAVYIARHGDTVEKISQKVFGSKKMKELCAANSYNCSRPVKVGDKWLINKVQ